LLTMTQDLLTRFHELVRERCDLFFPAAKQAFFENRLRERLFLAGHGDYESYYSYLLEQPDEMQSLLQGLTVNETRFFRNPAEFKALRERILPELIEKKNREVVKSWGDETRPWKWGERHPVMHFRVWSAGCSTGEEAYSIAFTILESLKFPRAWEIEITATDINRAVLYTARAGGYDNGSVAEIQPDMRARYMDSLDGGFIVKEFPASLVRFYEANLKDISAMPGTMTLKPVSGPDIDMDVAGYFDIIFCRNVMIYFERAAQQRLVDALYNCLKPGGCLFTGDAEPLHLFEHRFETVSEGDAIYYVKPSDGGFNV
jgi:chemotaxis protein methyltransferase CheR